MNDQTRPLGEGWDLHAHEWIAWSRTGLDSYEKFHRDAFLPMFPRAGQLTVDVGCGEGRVSRDLQALGHRVLAIDLSLVMSRAAATHPAAPVPSLLTDASQPPRSTRSASSTLAMM